MANPTLPPYLGSWEQLVNELLHNPYLGSGRGGVRPTTHLEEARIDEVTGPGDPEPWRSPITYLLSAITLRDAASHLPNGEGLVEKENEIISAFLDDFCGTVPRNFPWPWPGPPPWVYPAVSELTAIAHSFEAGSLRNGTLEVAGQMLERAMNASAVALQR